jgi:hypothetical protein
VAKRPSHEFMDGVTFPSPELARLRRGRLSPLPVARWRFESSKDPWRRLWEGEQETSERDQVTVTIDEFGLANEKYKERGRKSPDK